MRRVRAFAYVAIGILALSVVLPFWASPAAGQSFPGTLTPYFDSVPTFFMVSNGDIWTLTWGGYAESPQGVLCGNLFAGSGSPSATVVGVVYDIFLCRPIVVTANGDVWGIRWNGVTPDSGFLEGNVFGTMSPPSPVAAVWLEPSTGTPVVMTANGDMWMLSWDSNGGPLHSLLIGNFFGGSPVQTTPTTWGRIKAERR